MNSKELKKFLEAQKLQTYYLLNKNETFIFFNGIAKFKMKYNEDNILLAKNLNYPNSAYAQYDETPNFWLSLAEQMKLQYLEEYKTNKLNMTLFLVNSNLVLLRTEAKERLIKAEVNLQLEDEQIYKIDKKFISFFAEDLALWTSSEVSSNKIEHELYDKLKDDFVDSLDKDVLKIIPTNLKKFFEEYLEFDQTSYTLNTIVEAINDPMEYGELIKVTATISIKMV